MTFQWLFKDHRNENHDLPTPHYFRNKQNTTYECIPELVVTVPAAFSSTVKEIKTTDKTTYLKIFHNTPSNTTSFTVLKLLKLLLQLFFNNSHFCTVVKISWHCACLFSMSFPWPLMTFAVFQDFPGLENGLPKFHDFPRLSRTSGHPVKKSIFGKLWNHVTR